MDFLEAEDKIIEILEKDYPTDAEDIARDIRIVLVDLSNSSFNRGIDTMLKIWKETE